MAMSEEARAEYEKTLIAVVLKNGTMVERNASFYGWQDYDYHVGDYGNRPHTPHHLTCELDYDKMRVEETSWAEFMGTFYEGDTSVHGIVLRHINCACGKIKDREFRWSAEMSEVAEAVFEEAFGKKAEEAALESKCPGVPHTGHASSDWTCSYDRKNSSAD